MNKCKNLIEKYSKVDEGEFTSNVRKIYKNLDKISDQLDSVASSLSDSDTIEKAQKSNTDNAVELINKALSILGKFK